MGEGGEIFVLDMGEPVQDSSIWPTTLIRLSGLRAGRGHRDRVHRHAPGREALRRARDDRRRDVARPVTRKIFIGNIAELPAEVVGRALSRLESALARGNADEIKRMLERCYSRSDAAVNRDAQTRAGSRAPARAGVLGVSGMNEGSTVNHMQMDQDQAIQVPYLPRRVHRRARSTRSSACLRSGWLTTGPRVEAVRSASSPPPSVRGHAVAVNSCTAALHLAVEAARARGRRQAVLVPTMTFAATAEVVRYQGAVPILVDCDPVTRSTSIWPTPSASSTRAERRSSPRRFRRTRRSSASCRSTSAG